MQVETVKYCDHPHPRADGNGLGCCDGDVNHGIIQNHHKGWEAMAEQKLHYALRSGQLVSIDDVERGLQCNCVCPSCGAALIARKGDKREHHFAHYGETNCSGGVETALHLLAKNLLCSNRTIFVPGTDSRSEGSVKTYLNAELECRDYSSFIPDIVLKNETEVLGIEILVTHAVDEDKTEKIRAAQLPTIEIDLSDQLDHYNEGTVMAAILSGEQTEWIYNPLIAAREKELQIQIELSDHLKPVDAGNKKYFKCPELKRLVTFWSHCHECHYFIPGFDESRISCKYRTRKAHTLAVKDVKSVQRTKTGFLLSADLLVDDSWINWSPTYDETEVYEEKDLLPTVGKRLTRLIGLDCDAIIVRNLVTRKEWYIEVSQFGGSRFASVPLVRVMGERVTFNREDNRYYFDNEVKQELEPIPDAGDPIWEIVSELYR